LWRVNVLSGNQNTVFNFTQYSTGFPNAYKWSITPNTFTYQSGTSDTSANPIIKFNATANYSVQLKVTNPFSSDSLLRSSYISVQTVGLNNLTKNTTAISIFPNPTNGLVQIQSPISIQSILVFDITGKQLLQQEPNTQTDEININNLPQGLYQIHVQTEMGVLVKKLVKE
jgi:PKD repeat protein